MGLEIPSPGSFDFGFPGLAVLFGTNGPASMAGRVAPRAPQREMKPNFLNPHGPAPVVRGRPARAERRALPTENGLSPKELADAQNRTKKLRAIIEEKLKAGQ